MFQPNSACDGKRGVAMFVNAYHRPVLLLLRDNCRAGAMAAHKNAAEDAR